MSTTVTDAAVSALTRSRGWPFENASDHRGEGYFFNEMTGVLRSHRGRGIAIAMKVIVIEHVRALGVPTIRTIHHPGNEAPIALNRRLGYREENERIFGQRMRSGSDVTSSTAYGFATISNDGDVVAFQSSSDALVRHDTNGHDDVFAWRARVPWLLQRISIGPRLRQGDGDSYWPAVGGDGSSVAFVSQATNLVRDDTNGTPDAFVVELAPRRP
jgi:hypothetical protein